MRNIARASAGLRFEDRGETGAGGYRRAGAGVGGTGGRTKPVTAPAYRLAGAPKFLDLAAREPIRKTTERQAEASPEQLLERTELYCYGWPGSSPYLSDYNWTDWGGPLIPTSR